MTLTGNGGVVLVERLGQGDLPGPPWQVKAAGESAEDSSPSIHPEPGSVSVVIRSGMTNEAAAEPNAAQIQHWNETAGPRWVAAHEAIGNQLRGLGREAMDRAAFAGGSRVLDVGCGGGETTVEIAGRVGPTGAVIGVDVSLPLLTHALTSARAAGIANAAFTLADAQTAGLAGGAFDAVFSRFGVMFFSDPEVAFRNLRGALRPGGRLTFVCWRSFAENPLMEVPASAVATVTPLVPFDPHAPGPFAFADPERVRGMLERAGFAGVSFEKLDRLIPVGPSSGGLDAAAAFLIQMGPASAALRAAGPEVVPAALKAVREALAPHQTAEGLRMTSATWIVTASNG